MNAIHQLRQALTTGERIFREEARESEQILQDIANKANKSAEDLLNVERHTLKAAQYHDYADSYVRAQRKSDSQLVELLEGYLKLRLEIQQTGQDSDVVLSSKTIVALIGLNPKDQDILRLFPPFLDKPALVTQWGAKIIAVGQKIHDKQQ